MNDDMENIMTWNDRDDNVAWRWIDSKLRNHFEEIWKNGENQEIDPSME